MRSRPSAYHDEAGKPLLRRSITGFLDLLGFSHASTASSRPEESQEVLERIAGAIGDARAFVREEFTNESRAEPTRWTLKFFSDNLVFGYPVDADDVSVEWAAQFVVRCVQRYQLRMSLSGYFVRGALTDGLICLADEIIFGPALVECYQLESKTSIVPRVLVTSALQAEIGRAVEPKAARIAPDACDWICRDVDGWWFVNYLQAARGDAGIDWQVVERHKASVLSSLTTTTRHDVLAKFGWARRYHNVFCHWHRDDPGYAPAYRIDRGDDDSTIRRLGELCEGRL